MKNKKKLIAQYNAILISLFDFNKSENDDLLGIHSFAIKTAKLSNILSKLVSLENKFVINSDYTISMR